MEYDDAIACKTSEAGARDDLGGTADLHLADLCDDADADVVVGDDDFEVDDYECRNFEWCFFGGAC